MLYREGYFIYSLFFSHIMIHFHYILHFFTNWYIFSQEGIMQYLSEVLKIIEGGLQLDKDKIISYSKLLSENLAIQGDTGSSTRIINKINNIKTNNLFTQDLSIKPIPIDQESKSSLADEKYFTQNVEVYLDDHITIDIQNFIKYVKASDQLLKDGVGISPSMLIYGPPGCGKTELAHYIASQLKLPLIVSRSDTLISSYLGSTAKNIRQLFEYVNSRPCILFLDEFDSLAKVRDDHNELGELKRVVVSLLQNIDALDSYTILLAATNHEHLLDPAVWRRFNFKLNITLPNDETRSKIINKYSHGFIDEKNNILLSIASDGLSGSEIKNIIENNIRNKIVNNYEKINLRDTIIDLFKASNNQIDTSEISVIKHLRAVNPKYFTYEVISEIFNYSVGKISNLLK